MREMEYRGQVLLDKWISGEITYLEELELFELAEQDEMLKEALEGYIGQAVVFPEEVVPVRNSEPIKEIQPSTFSNRRMSLGWRAIAAILVIALVSTFYIFQSTQNGEEGYKFVIADEDFKLVPIVRDDNNESKKEVVSIDEKYIDEPILKLERKEVIVPITNNAIVAKVDEAPNKIIEEETTKIPTANEVNLDKAVAVLKSQELNIDNSDIDDTNLNTEMKIDEDGNIIPIGMSEREVAFFKSTQDDLQFKSDVRKSVVKDVNREQPITAYEIDVKSGVNPKDIKRNEAKDSNIVVNHAPIMVIADGNQSEIITAQKKKDVVIKEYEIRKVDILNPPTIDYNSMVRSKYKKKGSPTVGYLKYKHLLKKSVSCLLDTYKNAAYLEEVLLKFRVYKSGEVEFLELFGVNSEECIESVSKAISEGPSWELKEYYESIDVEVPFKVLYPYMF